MKKTIIKTFAILISSVIISCGNNNKKSNPSIQENSSHKKEIIGADYSNIPAEKLLKQIQAHYDLDEYQISKDKLTFLMKSYSDSLGIVDLNELKQKIDRGLIAEQKKKQEIAHLEQNKRLSGSLAKMRSFKEGKYTLYIDKSSPDFDTKECFYAYIKKDIYGAKLFFKVRYIDVHKLNIENYIINVDKLDYTLMGEVIKSQTKGKKKYNVELLDKEITTPEDKKILNAISSGEEVTALYVGKNNYKKRNITAAQKQAIQNVLDAYAFLEAKKKVDKIKITSSK